MPICPECKREVTHERNHFRLFGKYWICKKASVEWDYKGEEPEHIKFDSFDIVDGES